MSSTQFESIDWYDTPLYYDMVFDEDTELEADFLEFAHLEYGTGAKRARVLEPACGSGRLLKAMAQRGHRVIGNDLSQAMLDYSKRELARAGLRGKLSKADMADFQVSGACDLAHCLVSTFKYLLTEDAARSHLECVVRALKPGGVYVLGLHLSDYDDTSRNRERWVAERPGIRVTCNIQGWPPDRRKRLERVRSRLVVQEDGVEKRTETNWSFRTYDARQLERLLASVPAFEHVATYDFCYEIEEPRRLSDEQLDNVLILRKRA